MRRSLTKSLSAIVRRLPSIDRREAFALIWFLCFPLLIAFDGDIIRILYLFPTMGWDQSLKYYYIALSSVEALMLLLYGFVFVNKPRKVERRGVEVEDDYTYVR